MNAVFSNIRHDPNGDIAAKAFVGGLRFIEKFIEEELLPAAPEEKEEE